MVDDISLINHMFCATRAQHVQNTNSSTFATFTLPGYYVKFHPERQLNSASPLKPFVVTRYKYSICLLFASPLPQHRALTKQQISKIIG